jgi:hypothetical protein
MRYLLRLLGLKDDFPMDRHSFSDLFIGAMIISFKFPTEEKSSDITSDKP